MASIQFETIFNYFLGYMTDFDFLGMSVSDVEALEVEYLRKSLSKPYLRRLFSSLSIDEDGEEIVFELRNATDDDQDSDFVSDILAKSMVVEWLQPQVKSKLNTAQMFTGKNRTWYSQANHISELRAMLEDAQLDVRRMIRDRGYIYNSYLEN